MDAEKIIAALKHCASAGSCTAKCPLWNDFLDKWTINQCRNELMRNTAIAMECMQIESNKLREGLSKQMSDTVSSLRKEVDHLHQQVSAQAAVWHPGSEKPKESKDYLVMVMYCDVYGVPVSGLPRYEVAAYHPKYGWRVIRGCIVLHWQELPPEPIDEED